MNVEVVPLLDFQHGGLSLHENRPVSLAVVEAEALERAGLVRVKMAPTLTNQMMPALPHTKAAETPAGKARADGEATPSASLRAARVSPPKIATPSMRGAVPRRKPGT